MNIQQAKEVLSNLEQQKQLEKEAQQVIAQHNHTQMLGIVQSYFDEFDTLAQDARNSIDEAKANAIIESQETYQELQTAMNSLLKYLVTKSNFNDSAYDASEKFNQDARAILGRANRELDDKYAKQVRAKFKQVLNLQLSKQLQDSATSFNDEILKLVEENDIGDTNLILLSELLYLLTPRAKIRAKGFTI